MRRFLILSLALLQFAAPLLHAHTGRNFLVEGVHLPGLEFIIQHGEVPEILATDVSRETHGVIIGIGSGIELKDFCFDQTVDPCIILETPVLDHRIITGPVNFSPQLISFVIDRPSPPGSPRAPPAI